MAKMVSFFFSAVLRLPVLPGETAQHFMGWQTVVTLIYMCIFLFELNFPVFPTTQENNHHQSGRITVSK